jgi:hypothetical protein
MIRVKEFNATGVAPNGRLYAGDLLAIMDAAAGLSDFAQTVDMASLRIGDAAIQLLKYGTLDARITAALRVDKILRGLGGIIPGSFTTTQRNALAVADRPYGLLIQNTTTNRLEQNIGTDVTPVWVGVGAIEDNVVTLAKMADNSVSGAEIVAGHGGADDYGTVFPTTGLFNGYRFAYISGSVQGNFIYRADLDATYPWHSVGAPPALVVPGNSSSSAASGVWQQGVSVFTIPRAGVYQIELAAQSGGNAGGSGSQVGLGQGSAQITVQLQNQSFTGGKGKNQFTYGAGVTIHLWHNDSDDTRRNSGINVNCELTPVRLI